MSDFRDWLIDGGITDENRWIAWLVLALCVAGLAAVIASTRLSFRPRRHRKGRRRLPPAE